MPVLWVIHDSATMKEKTAGWLVEGNKDGWRQKYVQVKVLQIDQLLKYMFSPHLSKPWESYSK